ncbi:hypothetical protein BDZ91DRAFT_782535 [Kalaharituber pfeilii]|nr:hypothetical protein BDZ91DRAFT_782535 [Kalaharituber pfeilii]
MSDDTFHLTKEDVKKLESRESRKHKGGEIPTTSTTSALQSIVDSGSDQQNIDKTQFKLPLPDPPPVPGDMKSANQRTTGTGQGGALSGDAKVDELRDPTVKESSARISGAEYHKETFP